MGKAWKWFKKFLLFLHWYQVYHSMSSVPLYMVLFLKSHLSMLAFFLFPSQFEQVQMIIVGAFSTFAAPGQNLFSTSADHLDGMAENTTLKIKNNQIMIRPYSFNLHRSLDPPSCSPRWMTHLLVVYTDNFLRPVHMVPTYQKNYIKSNPVHGKISRNITIFSQLDWSKSTKEKIHRISWEPLFEKLKQVLPN